MKTTFVNTKKIERKWYLIDADGKTLGKIATVIADTLRGKNKPIFSPNHDNGDFVIVVNAEKVHLTGKKLTDKLYYRHSNYPGGLKVETAGKLLTRRPEELIIRAVRRMVPVTKIRPKILMKLKVYKGASHDHEAQQPINLEI